MSWSIKEGDAFVAGDVIAEIETDKAMMSWEATDDGTVMPSAPFAGESVLLTLRRCAGKDLSSGGITGRLHRAGAS